MENIQEIRNPFEQKLKDSGYKFFKDNWGNSLRGIQRRVTNSAGLKYFITGYHYNYSEMFPESNCPKGDTYSFNCQFIVDKSGKNQTINLEFSADFLPNEYRVVSTMEEMELFFKRAFVSFFADYYETNE